MEQEIQKEFDELNKYKQLVKLLWDYVDELDYDSEHYILTITFNELVLDAKQIKLFATREEANEMFEVFKLMEQENYEEQEVE